MTDSPPDTVRVALTRITVILLDLEDQLADATGDEPPPRAWAPAVDDLHAVLVELAKLAATISGHYDRWARANPGVDHAELGGAAEAVDALSHAWDALTEAVTAIGAARNASIHQPAHHRRDTADGYAASPPTTGEGEERP